jgi:hypothetical protein
MLRRDGVVRRFGRAAATVKARRCVPMAGPLGKCGVFFLADQLLGVRAHFLDVSGHFGTRVG